MIKDGTGHRKMEHRTNEDTGVGYCGLHVTIALNSVCLLGFSFCCFAHVSYDLFYLDLDSNPSASPILKYTGAHNPVTNELNTPTGDRSQPSR